MPLPEPVMISKLYRRRPLRVKGCTCARAREKHSAETTMIGAQQAAAYYDRLLFSYRGAGTGKATRPRP